MPEYPDSLRVVSALMERPEDEEDFVYDRFIPFDGATVHLHHTNDGPVVRFVIPMMVADDKAWRNLAYDVATMLLSETTNNDACDVTVRERSAHFSSHPEFNYLDLKDDLGWVVVDAYISDYLT
jgi:hypothetical protein